MPKTMKVEVEYPARERLSLQLDLNDSGEITSAVLDGIGCRATLQLMAEWRPKLVGKLEALPLPEGNEHSAIMLRELLLKAQGRWAFPYAEDEICHCRMVPTSKVDAAIVSGCLTIDEIKRGTSASTSCGACRTDIENIIEYRLRGYRS
jgi:bacterioferritin-associated ferredoxin